MNCELRKLSPENGADIYEMLQELPCNENGFINSCKGKTYGEYKEWLIRQDNISRNIGLEEWMVPGNVYWLYIDNHPVGFGKLRHRLTEKLIQDGGHVGYSIRPSYRNMRYGKLLLKLITEEAKLLGINRILLTIQKQNTYSLQTALSNGGTIEKSSEIKHYVWIECG